MIERQTNELVIDTSAVLAVLLDEPERGALIRVTRGATLLAPGSVPWEIGNGLMAGLRRKRLTSQQVRGAWLAFERIPLRLLDVAVSNALGLAEELGLYAYDAYVIEAARARRVPLLALDQRLRTAAVAIGIEVQEIRS